jgi:regulator of cell morphogenesis and NO signaling
MEAHMMKEEHVLFPYIKQLVRAHDQIEKPGFGNVVNPINIMEMEHELVGSKLEAIRTLTKNYLAPSDACTSYTLFYRMLNEFEADLHLHVHLENNILFPKAIELERKLMAKSFIN